MSCCDSPRPGRVCRPRASGRKGSVPLLAAVLWPRDSVPSPHAGGVPSGAPAAAAQLPGRGAPQLPKWPGVPLLACWIGVAGSLAVLADVVAERPPEGLPLLLATALAAGEAARRGERAWACGDAQARASLAPFAEARR
jgi:hypothetical protein